MSTADKLNKLLATKTAIKQAIINKGVEVPDDTIFADYPAKISAIESGGGGGNSYYETLWNTTTANNTDYTYLFSNNYNISDLDLSNIDMSNAISMDSMFLNCSNLYSLNLGYTDLWNLTSVSNMFYGCVSLQYLDLSCWYIYNLEFALGMFALCSNLNSLNLSTLDFHSVTTTEFMFDGCYSLVDFQAPMNINTSINFESCTELSYDSLMSIINNLEYKWSPETLILGSTNLDKLSDEDKMIATNKGWTLT